MTVGAVREQLSDVRPLHNRSTDTVIFPSDSRRIGYRESGAQNVGTTLGPLYQNIGMSSINGTVSGGANLFSVLNGSAGTEGPMIFYRFFLEDLTVSGRTYAVVDALDHAMFTQDVLTPGGYYYGDTFTNPATL